MAPVLRYIDSSTRTHGDTLLAWLLAELPAAQRLLVGSGYFDASILDWVEPQIKALLERGGDAHFVIGSNQGQTRREDLERLLAVTLLNPASASLFVVHIPDALFHHKTYFVRRPGHVAALVGSPNFTAASGTRNVEAALIVEADALVAPLDFIEASLLPDRIRTWNNAYRVRSATDLGKLAAMGVIDVPPPRVSRPSEINQQAFEAKMRRRRRRFPPSGRVAGTPWPAARPRSAIRAPRIGTGRLSPAPLTFVVFLFSTNDLKLTGTKEFSVPAGVKDWASHILGAQVRPGQGELMRVNLMARLAGSPNAVATSPEPVRLWSSGASGGTHQDVRLVLGNTVRLALEEQSVLLFGSGLQKADVGVLELPSDPMAEPLRLTLYRPEDPDYAALSGRVSRAGRQQKPQKVLQALDILPAWPY